MKKMKSKHSFYTQIISLIIQASLLCSTTTVYANNTVNNVLSVAGAATQGIVQAQQQMQQMALMQNMPMVSLIKRQPDDFAPHCQIIETRGSDIENICDPNSPPSDPMQIEMVSQKREIAEHNYREIEKLLIERTNKLGSPEGISCLNEAKDNVDKMLHTRLQRIDAIARDIQEATERFRERMDKSHLLALRKSNAELRGGTHPDLAETQDAREQRMASEMRSFAKCNEMIGKEDLLKSSKGGLIGIRENVRSKGFDEANQLKQRKNAYTQDLKRIAKEIARKAKVNTLAEVLSGKGEVPAIRSQYGLNNTPAIQTSYQQSLSLINDQYQSVTRDLQAHGINPNSSMGSLIFAGERNQNFDREIKRWRAQREYECFGQNLFLKEGHKSLLGAIENIDPLTSKSSTNVEHFRNRLERIFEQLKFGEISMAEAQNQIQAIDKDSRLVIRINETYNGNSASHPWRVTDLIKAANNNCKAFFASSSASSISDIESSYTIDQIENMMRGSRSKIKAMEQTYPTQIEQDIIASTVSCTGPDVVYSPGPADCNKDKLDITKPAFCLAHSSQCADAITSCHAHAESKIKNEINKELQVKKVYEQEVRTMVEQQRNLYRKIEAEVMTVAEGLNGIYPKFKYNIPADATIAVPDADSNNLQVVLDGINPEWKFTDPKRYAEQLLGNIDKLKQTVEQQNQDVLENVEDKIAEVRSNMNSELSRWKKIANDCNQAHLAASEQAGKTQQAVSVYCSEKSLMHRCPPDGAASELTSDMRAIVRSIDPKGYDAFVDAERTCMKFNQPKQETKYANISDSDVRNYCKENPSVKECQDHTKAISASSESRCINKKTTIVDGKEVIEESIKQTCRDDIDDALAALKKSYAQLNPDGQSPDELQRYARQMGQMPTQACSSMDNSSPAMNAIIQGGNMARDLATAFSPTALGQ